jgi:hypothetical protein
MPVSIVRCGYASASVLVRARDTFGAKAGAR